jgi:hypothetical protein
MASSCRSIISPLICYSISIAFTIVHCHVVNLASGQNNLFLCPRISHLALDFGFEYRCTNIGLEAIRGCFLL